MNAFLLFFNSGCFKFLAERACISYLLYPIFLNEKFVTYFSLVPTFEGAVGVS